MWKTVRDAETPADGRVSGCAESSLPRSLAPSAQLAAAVASVCAGATPVSVRLQSPTRVCRHAGNGFCSRFGTVAEENTIVNEVRSDAIPGFLGLVTLYMW